MGVAGSSTQERRRILLTLGSLAITSAIGSRNVLAATAVNAQSASSPSPKVKKLWDQCARFRWPIPHSPFEAVKQASDPCTIKTIPAEDPVVYRVDAPEDRRHVSTLGFQSPFPTGVQLAYFVYWQQVWTQGFPGPSDVTIKQTTKTGTAVTDSSTLSQEVGAGVNLGYVSLSAKLTQSFTHTIQVTHEDILEVTAPFHTPERKYSVCSLWQLVELFAYVDSAGNRLDNAGWWTIPPRTFGPGTAAAYEFMLPSGVVNRAPEVMHDQRLFDWPQS
jgi:hypothetical protein